MKGYIQWECVSCRGVACEKGTLRIETGDPGSSYVALLSRFLPSKKRVKINSLCENCAGGDEVEDLKKIQQRHFEANREESGKRKAWEQQEWQLWVSSAQYEELKDVFRQSRTMILSLSVGITLQGV